MLLVKDLVPLPQGDSTNPWLDQARTVRQLATLVPAGKIYDSDRASLLAASGQLLFRAAVQEIGQGNWAKAFNAHAEEAVRWPTRASLQCAGSARTITRAAGLGPVRQQSLAGSLNKPMTWPACAARRHNFAIILPV